MTNPRPCILCAEPGIVHDNEKTLCLSHAMQVICPCGHTAARCPIAGCGEWQPLDQGSATLLMFDFQDTAYPGRYPTH